MGSNSEGFVRAKSRLLVNKGVGYWIGFALVLALGIQLAVIADESTVALGARYSLHESLTALWPFERTGGATVVATVGDDVFYGPENQARTPLSPALIAKMFLRGEAAGATGIAPDFDFRHADPANPSLLGDSFAMEVQALENAVRAVASKIPVILPVMLNQAGTALEPSYLDGLQAHPVGNMRLGLVNLPQDLRYLPLGMFDARSGRLVEGFGLALARARRPLGSIADRLPDHERRSPMVAFQRRIGRISAHELLYGDVTAVREKVAGRTLILCGGWRTPTRADEKLTDVYETPAGRQSGGLIHANYAEAVLSGEVYLPAPTVATISSKVAILAFVGIAMVLLGPLWQKVLCVLATIVIQLAFGYFAFMNAGLSFDVAIPSVFIMVHALADHLWHGQGHGGQVNV